jgi:hypothetical protein
MLIPYVGVLFIFLGIAIFASAREKLVIFHNHSAIWSRHILGITVKERSFQAPFWVNLERDLYAPNGRNVMFGADMFQCICLGQPWDALWLYQEIKQSLERH